MKKASTIHRHARKRALQRYGVNLDTSDLREIASDIRCGKAILAAENNDGHTTSVWRVLPDWAKEPISVVYCERRQDIITVLPKKSRFNSSMEFKK